MTIRERIDRKDYQGLEEALAVNPELANKGIPFDAANLAKAHPLHRLCDGVFAGTYTEEEALKMAAIFLQHGAHIDGNRQKEKQDTPLLAAASLYADKLAFLYMDHGANIFHAGCHGGTALHWAAWCGRDQLVGRLIQAGAEINRRCIDYQATPLFWAIHGFKSGDQKNPPAYVKCVCLLVGAGADTKIPNRQGTIILDLLNDADTELRKAVTGGKMRID